MTSTAYNYSPYFDANNTNNHFNSGIIIASNFLQQNPNGYAVNDQHKQQQRDRQLSTDIAGAEAGCCLIKTLISNLLTFATRSRRKADLNSRDSRTDSTQNPGVDNLSNSLSTGMGVSSTAMGGVLTSYSGSKKTGLMSCSKVSSAKIARKKAGAHQVQSELNFVDSFDDEVIDKICTLPPSLDRNEWLATHTLDLFDQVNALCGTISEVCTPVTCPTMNYPGVSKASWVDERGKRHNYSSMRYIDSVMSFCEASRNNQQLFPTKFGIVFSADFNAHCRRMIRYLWHCCGHLYSKHWEHLGMLNLRSQYGLVLSHLARIARMYKLLEAKEVVAIHTTLQMVRPITANDSTTDESSPTSSVSSPEHQEKQRPAKRLNSGDFNEESLKTQASSTSPSSRAKISAAALAMSGGPPMSLSSLFWHSQPDTANYGSCSPNDSIFRIPAMKSGSWGGHSALIVATNNSGDDDQSDAIGRAATGPTGSSFKSFAQIC